ncbi:pterin-4a-carbinolamine dehydratase, putative [Plasmodium gallinaceum]|uniref:4a-hydroxytetrahydrobiopterin dehydratase n=1 Tax=Plasmodium gallinaceum TaxID=5849 RepID=A0A1J1GUI8_PLAGA|nr:pterin-4a-carbinolamine dehydratase, putative [Plasmodium gallinaceum]CRG96141.1 pterin-4a-carbinolamine dehydratase, putative [Plasmodium gallinaceum]
MIIFDKNKINTLIPLWNYKTKKECYNYIERKIRFPSFSQAWKFMNEISKYNEKLNHHCKYINDYNKVKIKIHTHISKDITDKDIKLAHIIDETLKNYEHDTIKEKTH